jgi:Cu+-exporting ATPase
MNQEGVIVVRVTAHAAETVHAHIVRLMEEAQRSRSPIQQSVDRVAGIFIPVVMVLSFLTFIGWLLAADMDTALLHALTVLVVACPCALGIGTPLASAIALGRAAEEGLLIRTSAVLEKLADSKHIVFDKTGTLTKGEPRLWELRTKLPEKEFLGVVASLERNSEHPLGRAITESAETYKADFFDVRNVSVLPGFGIKGEVNIHGRWVMVQAGSSELFDVLADNLEIVQNDERSATVMYAGWDGAVQGSMIFNDALRRHAKDAVLSLGNEGLQTHILSGDSRAITQSIADALSIKQAHGKLLPQDKLEIIHQLKSEGVTVMVGDGINDAPALSAADVGITLGSATDIAKESADVTILGDHLEKIPWLIRFARRTLGVIRWNLLWAFGYNAVGIALAVSGILQPILAAVAMVLSSVFIIVHSRRLASIRVSRPSE